MVGGTALRIEPSPDVDEGAFGNECRSLGIPRRLTPGSPPPRNVRRTFSVEWEGRPTGPAKGLGRPRALVARWESQRRPVLGQWKTEAGAPEMCLSSPAGLMSRER